MQTNPTLSGSVFAWVHATTEDLPLPGPYPIGRQTAEVQAEVQRRMHWCYLQPVCVTSRECAHVYARLTVLSLTPNSRAISEIARISTSRIRRTSSF